MAEKQLPPTFDTLRSDPEYAALDPNDKRAALLRLRDWQRHEARAAGTLPQWAPHIDASTLSAAKADGIEIEPGFFGALKNDIIRGYAGVKAGFNALGEVDAEDARDIADATRMQREASPTLAQRDFTAAAGLGQAWREDPLGTLGAIGHSSVESLTGSAVSLGAGASTGAGASAGYGALAGPKGVVAAGLIGAAVGAGGASGAMETGSRLLAKLAESGVNLEDQDAVARAFADTALITRLKKEAALEALPTAVFDGASALIPGAKIGGRVAAKIGNKALAKGAEWAVETGLQGAMGASGSIGSNLVAGEDIDWKEAAAEFAGEAVSGVGEVTNARLLTRMEKTKVPSGAPTSSSAPAARPEAPAAPERRASSVDDLLGEREIAAVREAETAGRARAEKLAGLRSTYLTRFANELQTRADAVRERGGEGDQFLSAVEQELARIRDDQSGDRRAASLPAIRKVVERVLPDGADPDAVDTLAMEFHGADAESSRANLAAALGALRVERARAFDLDAPARDARLAQEAETLRRRNAERLRQAEASARIDSEHAAEMARLDAARVTPEGALDLAKFSDDDLADFAHGDPETGLLDRAKFGKTLEEARRVQDANPDYADRPAGALMREWRDAARAEFDARMNAQSVESDQGPSLRELLLKGKIQLPDRAATYSGELRALRESFTPAERLRIFRKVADAADGDTMLERAAERLTVDEGFGFLASSGADLLDALSRSAAGEHLRPDWSEGGVAFSRAGASSVDSGPKFAERWVEQPHDEQTRRAEHAVRRTEIRRRGPGAPDPVVHTVPWEPSGGRDLPAGRLLEGLSAAFSKRIRFLSVDIDGVPVADGFINSDDVNTIWLDPRSSRPFATIVGHELVETMLAQRPELYTKLRRAIGPFVKDWSLVDEHMRGTRGYADARRGALRKEFIADFVGNNLGKESFWNRLAQSDRGVFRELAVMAREFITTTLARLRRRGLDDFAYTRSHFTDLKAARAVVAEALLDYASGPMPERRLRPSPDAELTGRSSKDYADPKQNPDFMKKIGVLQGDGAPLNAIRLQLPMEERSRYRQRTIYGPHDLPQADSDISFSRRPRGSKTAPEEALPLTESERDTAARRLAEAQNHLAALQAAGKKVGGESYKNTPAYKKALADRDAAFAAVTELSKAAPAPKPDRLAELSAEREKLFREINEGQPSPEEAAAKQRRLAEINRELKAAESSTVKKPAPDWRPENFDAAAWAGRILADKAPGDLPPPDHFRALGDNRLGELVTELKQSRDRDNASRVDAVLANLDTLRRDRRTRGVPSEPTPTAPAERAEARARLTPPESDDISPERMEKARRRLKRIEDINRPVGGDDLLDHHGPVPVDELTLPREALDVALPEEPPVALSREDLEAVAKLPSELDPRDGDRTRRELDALEARDTLDAEIQAALDELPPVPPETPGELPVRNGPDAPASRAYGHSTSAESKASAWVRHFREFVRGFKSAVPELPVTGAEAREYRGVIEGYKELKRAGDIALHDAEQAVMRIVRPLFALEKPVDPALRQELHKVREEQTRLNKAAEESDKSGRHQQAAELRKREAELNTRAGKLIEDMADSPLVIFENFILWRDFMHRAPLRRANGEAITLPFGVNGAEATAEAPKWARRLQDSPHRAALLEAVRNHERFVTESWADFEKRNLPVQGLWNGGKAYFPHVLPDHWSGKADRVAVTTGADVRKYLKDPFGSLKRIETDYLKAMWYHAAAIATDNAHQDIVERRFKPFDITEKLKAEQQAMRVRGEKDIPALGAMIPDDHVRFNPGDELRFARQPVIDRDKLSRAIGRVIGNGPLGEELQKLKLAGITLKPEWLQEQLVKVESEDWIVPAKVADALRGIMKREESVRYESAIARAMQTMNGAWKKYTLFAPWNYLRYEYGNTTADVMKLLAADPAVLARLPEAFREIKGFIEGAPDETLSPEVRRAFRLGVFETPTMAEIGELHDLHGLERKLHTDRQNAARTVLGWMGKDWSKYTKLKEATLRFAKYKADLERLDNGASPVFAGAYWRDIEAVGESYPGAGDAHARKAAAISLATLNDIHAISVSGQHLRKTLIPFYSFLENNFRYHANLFRNMGDAVRGKNPHMTGRAALAVGARLAAPFFAAALYNALVGGDDELSDEDRRRLHINLGRDDRGRMRVLYVTNDFADVTRWFAGPRAAAALADVATGKAEFETVAADFSKNAWRDVANTAAGIGPAPRIGLDLLGKSAFPDATQMRNIPAYDIKWAVLNDAIGMLPADLARRALDKDYYSPRDAGDWLSQLVLQVRRRDPEQWAYFDLRDKAEQFAEERTGRRRDPGSVDAPDAVALRNFRSAIYRGDMDAAMRLYSALLGYGYTADRLRSSIATQDPLAGLSKTDGTRRAFVASLSEWDRRQLDRAYLYYQRIAALKGRETLLFPAKASTPAGTEARLQTYRLNPRLDALRATLEAEQRESEEKRRMDADLARLRSLSGSR